MTIPGAARPLCFFLSLLMAAPGGFAQTAQPAPLPPATPPQAVTGKTPVIPDVGAPLSVLVLEGKDAINSLTLLHSTPPIVEVRDQNEFPLEGATVTFTLPTSGPGGTFAGVAGNTFTIKSDSHGQASTPLLVPSGKGKFVITVNAVSGNRKGEVIVHQTNTEGGKPGHEVSTNTPWYKKKLPWIIAGGAVVAVVVVVLTTGGSSSSSNTVTVTPGTPVFH